MNNELGLLRLGVRGLAYIALSKERQPSDQTDPDGRLILNLKGGGGTIYEIPPDWPQEEGAHPRSRAAALGFFQVGPTFRGASSRVF
jgi:hypothetical protein